MIDSEEPDFPARLGSPSSQMNLPQELLDEILSHLPPHDGSFHRCSLVSKSWLEPSRRRLFSSIYIDPYTYKSWLKNVSPANVSLLRHVRRLEYTAQPYESERLPGMPDHSAAQLLDGDRLLGFYNLRDYFPSCQLNTLVLCNIELEPTITEHLEIFSAFQHTLSSLSLTNFTITWSAFVALVGYFPRLQYLEIWNSSVLVDDTPVPELPHTLHGRLVIGMRESAKQLVDLFLGLKQEYEELEMATDYEPRLVAAAEASLKSLRVEKWKPESAPDLSRCSELRQLDVTTTPEEELAFISSITSTNFRKLVFSEGFYKSQLLGNSCWIPLDDAVCGLADKLRASGSTNTFEIEIQIMDGIVEEDKTLLPKFSEKGQVKFTRWTGGLELEV